MSTLDIMVNRFQIREDILNNVSNHRFEESGEPNEPDKQEEQK